MAKDEKKTLAPQGRQQKKLSYEELNQVASQLQEQNHLLHQRCGELINEINKRDASNLFKRMDYLFKVLDHADKFPADFVTSCSEEIIARMTIPAEKEQNPQESEKKDE